MVPNVNARGTSFKGVTAYLMHDKDNAETSERVEWTATRNMITDDIEKASKIMAFTDMHSEGIKRDFGGSAAGAKREVGGVYHFSLSESPENKPTQEEWEKYVDDNIKVLGLEGHQYYMVSHNDEPHAHVHVVVNLVHPETGKINSLHNDYKKMDKLAHEYELENGIVCEDRDKKYKAWEQEQNAFKEKERREEYAVKVTQAFEQSDNSKSFKSALEHEGLTLAQGNRRGFVLVDQNGEIFALNRLISFDDGLKRKEKNAAINDKLEGIDKAALPVADKLQEERRTIDREAQEVKAQNALADSAEIHAKETEKQEVEKAKAEKLLKEKQKEIHERGRNNKSELWDLQQKEKTELTQKLKDTNSFREKQNREYYEHIINADKKRIEIYKTALEKTGFGAAVYRLRHGKFTREEIENIEKNIENTQMRLADAVGGLTTGDYRRLTKQRQTHYEQREALRNSIELNLRDAEAHAKVLDMERDAVILSERAKLEEKHSKISVKNDHENVRGEKMSDPRTSREKWEDLAMTERFEDIAAKLHHPEATVEKIFEQEEAQRQELESANTNKVSVETEETNIQEWEAKEAEHHKGGSWAEWQEYFEERREEISHDKTITEEQRTLAHDELEEEYYENQSVYEQQQTQEHNEEQIQDQDQGLER